MLPTCERHGVDYIVGIAQNPRLRKKAGALIEQALRDYKATGQKQRLFGSIFYSAYTWDQARRVIVKAEHSARGPIRASW